jgi:hypothetical protein
VTQLSSQRVSAKTSAANVSSSCRIVKQLLGGIKFKKQFVSLMWHGYYRLLYNTLNCLFCVLFLPIDVSSVVQSSPILI